MNLNVLKTLYKHVIKLINFHEFIMLLKVIKTTYYITLIKLLNDFKTKLKNIYMKDN